MARFDFSPTTLKELLTTRYFNVPRYQRSYSWTSDETEDFWHDIVHAAEDAADAAAKDSFEYAAADYAAHDYEDNASNNASNDASDDSANNAAKDAANNAAVLGAIHVVVHAAHVTHAIRLPRALVQLLPYMRAPRCNASFRQRDVQV